MLEPVTEPVRRLIAKYESRIERLEKANGRLCEQINAMPEIVRCRDCDNPSFDEFGGGWCNENCREVKPWDYCSWGEPKEGGDGLDAS